VRKHLAAMAAIAAALVLLNAPLAWSHAGGNPDYRSVIDRVTPNVPGVSFEVLSYDAYFQLLDQHGHEVVIYGYEGEPYARVLKDGTVQVNERSPAYYLNETRYPVEATVPPSANAKAPPKWKTFDDSGTFLWHDHRMHYGAESVPPQVKDKSKKTKVFDYEIPISVDGRKGAIAGTLYWVGEPKTSKLPFIVVGALIVFGGGAAVLFVRRRRRDEDPGGEPPVEKTPAKEAW
jgi:hypothetical protein